MADVAITYQLLSARIWPAVGGYLSSIFGDPSHGAAFLAVLAGLHDVGKISPGFQTKVPELAVTLGQAGLSFPAGAETDHGRTTMEFLVRAFAAHPTQTGGSVAAVFAQAAACHHGSYLPLDAWYDEPADSPQWESERSEHFRSLCSLFGLDANDLPPVVTRPPAQWTVVAAGLISVSDWIASSLPFPVAASSPSEYLALRGAELEDLLAATGFRVDRLRPRVTTFGALFGPDGDDSWTPNGTQQLLVDLTHDIDGPFLAIVESPTGSGKSEAAMRVYAERARSRSQGLYFALPTMATTNAMFARVESFLNRLFQGDEAQIGLLQSEARMHEGFRRLLARGANGGESAAKAEAARAYEWFAGAKRGLLSEHAVGTVDQIMLAAMMGRHHFVRMLGLTDKVVVVDEIHAYDTYMQYIIESLLAWLRSLDTPVVLLSATLPERMRRDLLRAYAGSEPPAALATGPNVSVWSEEGVVSAQIRDIVPRQIVLAHHELADRTTETFVQEAAEAVLGGVLIGGCVACIVNTVDEAQKVYELVNDQLESSVPRYLLHARFVRRDRSAREELIQRLFGPGTDERPTRAVVVATQVLEQSLDVDFDYLVTDLAPIDLLIQRLGRVHRHTARRPSAGRPHPIPVAEVLIPPISDFRPRDSVAAIYEPVVLARTALSIANRAGAPVRIPGDDRELLEAVYGETPIGDEALAQRLDEWEEQTIGKTAAHRFAAAVKTLPRPADTAATMLPLAAQLAELDDWTAATRLGTESKLVVVTDEAESSATEDLVAATVRVSSPALVASLSGLETPEEWRDHWFLRRCVPLRLDGDTELMRRYHLSYSRELGLVIRRRED